MNSSPSASIIGNDSEYEEISLSAFQQQGQQVEDFFQEAPVLAETPPVVLEIVLPPCTSQINRPAAAPSSASSIAASSFLPQMAALDIQSTSGNIIYKNDDVKDDDDDSSISSSWSRLDSSNNSSVVVVNSVPRSSARFESSLASSYSYDATDGISSCDSSSVISGFDLLNIDGSVIVRCHRCTYHNKQGSVICAGCSAALVANPNVEMDAQIARNLQNKEENEAVRKRKDLFEKPAFLRAQAWTDDIMSYIRNSADVDVANDSSKSWYPTGAVRTLTGIDLVLLATSFIECLSSKQEEGRVVGPPTVKLAYNFTFQGCNPQSSKHMFDELRQNGFTEKHLLASTNVDDALNAAMIARRNAAAAVTMDTTTSGTATSQTVAALYSIPEETITSTNNDPLVSCSEFVGWIVAFVDSAKAGPNDDATTFRVVQPRNGCVVPLVYFLARRKNEPCIQQVFQGLSSICDYHFLDNKDWLQRYSQAYAHDNNDNSCSISCGSNNKDNTAVQSFSHKKIKLTNGNESPTCEGENVWNENPEARTHMERIEEASPQRLQPPQPTVGQFIEEVYDGVHDGPVLPRLVTHKATRLKYVVKIFDSATTSVQQAREEIFIHSQLDHPNIVRLHEAYECHSGIYLVQEWCCGGGLFDRLDEQPDLHYNEAECVRLVKQMLSAVCYLHNKGIMHSDIKLENFLFSTVNADSELKLIDFGSAQHFITKGQHHQEQVGEQYCVAPEVIQGSYDERCDVWSIGIITFMLLSGDPPFGGLYEESMSKQVRANILSGHFEFKPEDIWSRVSEDARHFIMSLLVTDPQKRPTAQEALNHKWLQADASSRNTNSHGGTPQETIRRRQS